MSLPSLPVMSVGAGQGDRKRAQRKSIPNSGQEEEGGVGPRRWSFTLTSMGTMSLGFAGGASSPGMRSPSKISSPGKVTGAAFGVGVGAGAETRKEDLDDIVEHASPAGKNLMHRLEQLDVVGQGGYSHMLWRAVGRSTTSLVTSMSCGVMMCTRSVSGGRQRR